MLGIDIAKEYIGLTADNDTDEIIDLLKSEAKDSDIVVDPSKIPWCAAYVNFCERKVGNQGTGKVNAQSFLDYGDVIELDNAQRGDIVVFRFPGENEWQGHVTYFDKKVDETLYCIGGNQGNMIKESLYSDTYVLGVRRPNNDSMS